MARDRKRAKQRQRRAQRASSQRVAVEARRAGKPADDEPVEEALPDPEVAQTALGRVGDEEPTGLERAEEEAAEEFEEEEAELIAEVADEQPPSRPRGQREPASIGGESTRGGGNRLINFLRACWAELQRVQWPDRRQVAQATGVVLGFVAIAGAYLGLMDAIFSRLVDAIL